MDKIVFFDIDGTLITKGHYPGFLSVATVVAKLKKQGVIFGINTNRPWAETRDIYKKLKLNGPIILENGAAYKLSYKSPEKLLNFRARGLNKKIAEFLSEALPCYFFGIAVVMSNKKSFLRQKRLLALISKNRRYTASIYIRGRKKISEKDLNFILNILRNKFPRSGGYIFKKISDVGKIIASNNFYDRIKTMRYVRNCHFSSRAIFFISDEEEVNYKKNIYFCAVKNASEKYKKRCLLVAAVGGQRGIRELLKKIADYL